MYRIKDSRELKFRSPKELMKNGIINMHEYLDLFDSDVMIFDSLDTANDFMLLFQDSYLKPEYGINGFRDFPINYFFPKKKNDYGWLYIQKDHTEEVEEFLADIFRRHGKEEFLEY